jgi:type I restriction enzyme S subunit
MSELYELPDGWEWKKLKDIFTVKDGTHDSPKYISENGYPLFTSKNLKKNGLDKSNYKLINEEDFNKINQRSKVDKGDLLFAMIGTIGNPTLIDYEPNFAIKNVALFKPLDVECSIEILRYYFLSGTVINKMLSEAKGATQKFVGLTYLRNFPFPKIPLQEQKRIVAKLDTLFEKIDKSIALHQKNMDEADVFMGSVLNDVFGELEEKYEKYLLSNYCHITSSKRVYKSDYVDDGVLFYRIKDIVLMSKGLPIRDSQYIKKEAFDIFNEKFGSPKSGDILLTAVGATLGYTYLVTDDDEEFYFKDGNLLWLKNIHSLDRKYLLHIFKSPLFDNYLNEISKGAAQPAITIIKLKEFKIPIPPLNIQQKTVIYLDSISQKIEKIKSVQKEKMESLVALKASILDQSFRGEL